MTGGPPLCPLNYISRTEARLLRRTHIATRDSSRPLPSAPPRHWLTNSSIPPPPRPRLGSSYAPLKYCGGGGGVKRLAPCVLRTPRPHWPTRHTALRPHPREGNRFDWLPRTAPAHIFFSLPILHRGVVRLSNRRHTAAGAPRTQLTNNLRS